MEALTPVEILALSRLFDPRTKAGKAARGEVEAGEYEFDFSIRVFGSMTVRDDYTARIVAKARPWVLLMLLADKVNEAKLQALVREAAEIDKGDPRVEEFKARVTEAVQAIKEPTKTPCKGRVQAKAVVQPVGPPIAA